ncbi:MAG: metallophosphoesterase [Synergistaceae bacterium]|jgi:serine/threonine protein phosphatase 1|nr:metallophosphoesterase [Synergistaceae bacterium]
MLWVIGDVHGMYDALEGILSGIRSREMLGERTDKVVFIGDLIDRGPASKEVMDRVAALEYDKVILTGNHEDMAMRFIDHDVDFLWNYGNQWFGNGGVKTYESILGAERPDLMKKLSNCHDDPFYEDKDPSFECLRIRKTLQGETSEVREPGFSCCDYSVMRLPAKYEDFIRCGTYSYKENGVWFFHGVPRSDQSLEVQAVKTRAEFDEYRRSNGRVPIDFSFLWGRDYDAEKGYDGLLVHGHTPVRRPDGLPFLFSRGRGAGYRQTSPENRPVFDCGEGGKLEAINVDTAAVFGGALSAVGLSAECLARGEIPLLTVFTPKSEAASENRGSAVYRVIQIERPWG